MGEKPTGLARPTNRSSTPPWENWHDSSPPKLPPTTSGHRQRTKALKDKLSCASTPLLRSHDPFTLPFQEETSTDQDKELPSPTSPWAVIRRLKNSWDPWRVPFWEESSQPRLLPRRPREWNFLSTRRFNNTLLTLLRITS